MAEFVDPAPFYGWLNAYYNMWPTIPVPPRYVATWHYSVLVLGISCDSSSIIEVILKRYSKNAGSMAECVDPATFYGWLNCYSFNMWSTIPLPPRHVYVVSCLQVIHFLGCRSSQFAWIIQHWISLVLFPVRMLSLLIPLHFVDGCVTHTVTRCRLFPVQSPMLSQLR